MLSGCTKNKNMNWQTHDVRQPKNRHSRQSFRIVFVGNSQDAQGTGRASAKKNRADFSLFSLFFCRYITKQPDKIGLFLVRVFITDL